jgi:hypothetical protein
LVFFSFTLVEEDCKGWFQMGLFIDFSKGLTGVLFELKCKMKNKDNHSHLLHSSWCTLGPICGSRAEIFISLTFNPSIHPYTRRHHSQSTLTVIHIKFRNSEIPNLSKTNHTYAHATHPTSSITHTHMTMSGDDECERWLWVVMTSVRGDCECERWLW